MPANVVQLAQGNTFSESSEGGRSSYTATRSWRVILNSPNEEWSVSDAVGVNIGYPYLASNPIPCVSLEARADGDSRIVRIVTATYRATPGVDPIVDPKTVEPELRPANYSVSTSLQEITAWGGKPVRNGASQSWTPAVNPVGDMYDGVTRLEPVVNIQIDQFSYFDETNKMGLVGYVNSDVFFFSALTIGAHCCMLQGVTSNPIVERFGDDTFRGFRVQYTFAVRRHDTITRDGYEPVGWDLVIPQTGFNVINSGLGRSDVDQYALSLTHKDGKIMKFNGAPFLAFGSEGIKARAMVAVPAQSEGDETTFGTVQRPSSQPVALNDDGTPRNTQTQNPQVLINRACLQPEMEFRNNFAAFGIRIS